MVIPTHILFRPTGYTPLGIHNKNFSPKRFAVLVFATLFLDCKYCDNHNMQGTKLKTTHGINIYRSTRITFFFRCLLLGELCGELIHVGGAADPENDIIRHD